MMKIARTVIVASILLCGVFEVPLAVAGSDAIPSSDFLTAALNNQLTASGQSLEVKYTYEQKGTSNGRFDIAYIRTHDVLYMEIKDQSGYLSQNSYDISNNEYKQKTSIDNSNLEGLIAEGLSGNGELGTQTTPDPVLRPLDNSTLIDLIARGKVIGKEMICDSSCWRVETDAKDTSSASRFVIWLDPSVGYNPRRIEIDFKASGYKPKIINFSEFKEVTPGFWFPWLITYDIHITGADNIDQDIVMIAQVIEVNVNKPMIKACLIVSFPSKTHVRDEKNNAEYTIP